MHTRKTGSLLGAARINYLRIQGTRILKVAEQGNETGATDVDKQRVPIGKVLWTALTPFLVCTRSSRVCRSSR
jgi:hypothetical protein